MQENNIEISILIPTFNEAKNIRTCIDAILSNNIDMSVVEILIIDGGSKDDTIDKIKNIGLNNIKIILEQGCSVYQALNIGLKNAGGKYIVRVDARSIIPPNYITKCISNLQQYLATVAGGIQLQYGDTVYQQTIAEVLQTTFGTGGAKFRQEGFSGFVDTVYLGVFEKKIFGVVGNYDDDGIVVSEDSMMNNRIRETGGKIYLDGSLKVLYPAKGDIRALFRQYFIYGGAKAHTFKKYGRLTALRQYIVVSVFMLSFFLFFATVFGLLSSLFLIGFIILYWICVIFASLNLKIQKGSKVSFLYSLMTYPAIHFAWALGFYVRYVFGQKLAPYFFTSKKKSI